MEERQIPGPPAELFERQHRHQTTGETIPLYHLDEDRKPSCIECLSGKGMFVYRTNAEYPEKGFPTPEGMYALNQVKRLLVIFSRLCFHPLITLGVALMDKNILMSMYNEMFDKLYETHAYKEIFFCDAARYFNKFLSSFLVDCGFNEEISKGFAFRVSQIVEGDNMYRYRIQDIAGEFNKENNPATEVRRLFGVYSEREETPSMVLKIKRMVVPLQILLLIPKYREAFIKNSHFIEKMKLDDGDYYWASLAGPWNSKPNGAVYNWRGTTWEERMAQIKQYPIRDYGKI